MTILTLMKMTESYSKGKKTLGEGEIARYEQFLLLPQCFQKTCTATTKKSWLVWERVNCGLLKVCNLLLDHHTDFAPVCHILYGIWELRKIPNKMHPKNGILSIFQVKRGVQFY